MHAPFFVGIRRSAQEFTAFSANNLQDRISEAGMPRHEKEKAYGTV